MESRWLLSLRKVSSRTSWNRIEPSLTKTLIRVRNLWLSEGSSGAYASSMLSFWRGESSVRSAGTFPTNSRPRISRFQPCNWLNSSTSTNRFRLKRCSIWSLRLIMAVEWRKSRTDAQLLPSWRTITTQRWSMRKIILLASLARTLCPRMAHETTISNLLRRRFHSTTWLKSLVCTRMRRSRQPLTRPICWWTRRWVCNRVFHQRQEKVKMIFSRNRHSKFWPNFQLALILKWQPKSIPSPIQTPWILSSSKKSLDSTNCLIWLRVRWWISSEQSRVRLWWVKTWNFLDLPCLTTRSLKCGNRFHIRPSSH